MRFEYVASGLNHLRLNNPRFINLDHKEGQKTLALLKDYMNSLNSDNHLFSVLFNAFVEQNLGKYINQMLSGVINNIYADSGGLQIVTKGELLTPDLKAKVYDIQAKYSTIAMSFDEIPVILTGDRSTFHDVSTRYYDPDILEEKARLSGKNLKEQIILFLNLNSKSRPMMILQGNDFNSYQKWLDYMVEEIGVGYLPYIKGIASGASALGQKTLEDVERMFILSTLHYPIELSTDHIHLLGVGSLSRFFPLRALQSLSFFNNEKIISYDSTTHTSGLSLGSYYFNHKNHKIFRSKSKNILESYNDINENMGKLYMPKITYNQFNDFIINFTSESNRYCVDKEIEIKYQTILSCFVSAVYNFKNDLDRIFNSECFYDNLLHEHNVYVPFKTLEKCNDLKDFNLWSLEYGKFLPSLRVKSKDDILKKSSLEGFFN